MPEPRLVVKFKKNDNGEPDFTPGGKLRHYKISLEVENPPHDTYAANFELDPSYYDPLREVTPDKAGKIVLDTTSYGDYDVVVNLRTERGAIKLKTSLVEALRRSVEAERQPAMVGALAASDPWSDALKYISNH